jgi:hypothetical protein
VVDRLEVHVQGGGVVVRRRADGADAARLAATAERLVRAAHPGVVEVLRSAGTDDSWELELCHAGRPVELLGPLPPPQVAAIAASVAATLADLHVNGVVHGHLDGSHVLIGAQGRPVLCGFGVDDGGAGAHDDVAAVGSLIVELLAGDAGDELVPERRWGRRHAPDGAARRSLLLLADHACAEPASRRPSASRLAAAIATAVPEAQLVEPDGPVPPATAPMTAVDPLEALRATSAVAGDDRSPRRSVAAIAVAAVVLGAIVFGAGALRPPVHPTAAGPSAGTGHPRSSNATSAAATVLPPTTMPPAPAPVRCPVEPDPSAPVGCGPAVVEGTVVTVGGHRFEVGQPGDRVVVGDWDCDGIATAAALRPSTGEVFVFTTWTSGPDVVVPAMTRIADGVDLVIGPGVADGGGRCAPLAVRRRDGSLEPVAVRGTA